MSALTCLILCHSLMAAASYNLELWEQRLRGSLKTNSMEVKTAVSQASNVPSSSVWGGVAIDYSGTHLFAAQDPGGLYMSSNRGVTWKLATNGIPTNAYFFDVACSNSGQYVIASTSTATLLSSNFGSSWSTTNIGSSTAVGTSGSGNLIAALQSTAVQVSTDFGVNFGSIGDPSSGSPAGIAVSTNGTIIVASYRYKGVYTATFVGSTWIWSSGITLPSSNYDVPVAFGGGYFYASTGSTIYKSSDGITWVATGSLPYWDGVALNYISAGDSSVVASNAQLFYSGNGGKSYVQKSGTSFFNLAVSGDDSNGVWISNMQVYYGDFGKSAASHSFDFFIISNRIFLSSLSGFDYL